MRRDRATTRRLRRIAVGAVVLVAGTVVSPAAVANPSPAPVRGTPVCAVGGGPLTEISGMVATDDGFVVVNDGADDETRRRIFFLDPECSVVRTVPYPSRPADTEDLAIGADGTIWVADIGDNGRSRQTIAVWKLPPGDDRPIIVTKYSAGLYAPTAALQPGTTAPLARVGQVRLPASTTSNPFGGLGRTTVTGAATAPDGRRVVLRTYADAFEFEVVDGDVLTALTSGTPRMTALPDEPQGESITYSRDGRSLLTVSETADQPAGTKPGILRYPLAAAVASTEPQVTSAPPARADDGRGERTVATPIVVTGALGLGLIVVGLVAVTRSRRARSR